jgi:branched-chain amino acid transport system permease protein
LSFYDSNVVFIQATFINLLLVFSIQVPLRTGAFSMAGIGCYGIGSYAAAILTTKHDWATWPAIAVAVLVPALVSYALGVVLGRLGGLYLAMATIAFDLIVKVVAFNGGSLTGGAVGLFGALDAVTTLEVFLTAVLVVALLHVSESGRYGRRLEAARDDAQLADAMGVNVARVRRLAFAASGAIAGLAGAFNFLIRSVITPEDITFGLLVAAFTMLIVGGMHSWRGALVGVLIFTWLPEVFQSVSGYMPIVYGVIVTLVAVWAPQGVLGLYQSGVRRLRKRVRALGRSASEEAGERDASATVPESGALR